MLIASNQHRVGIGFPIKHRLKIHFKAAVRRSGPPGRHKIILPFFLRNTEMNELQLMSFPVKNSIFNLRLIKAHHYNYTQ